MRNEDLYHEANTRDLNGDYELQRRQTEQEELHMAYAIMNTEPYTCSYFGCGVTLSPQQRLYGDCCPDHSTKQHFDITKAIKLP